MLKFLASTSVLLGTLLLVGCSSSDSTSDGVKPMTGKEATPAEQAAAKAQLDAMPPETKPGMTEPRGDGK